jgi:hypothetical protein
VTVESWVDAEEKGRIFESVKTDLLLEVGVVFADSKIRPFSMVGIQLSSGSGIYLDFAQKLYKVEVKIKDLMKMGR